MSWTAMRQCLMLLLSLHVMLMVAEAEVEWAGGDSTLDGRNKLPGSSGNEGDAEHFPANDIQLPDRGLEPDTKDLYLYMAAMDGNLERVKALIAQGADLWFRDPNNGWTVLRAASFYGHSDVVKVLLDEGAPVDQASASGFTALMTAAESGQQGCARLLINAGANVNCVDAQGNSALSLARRENQWNIYDMLLASGATEYEAPSTSPSTSPSSNTNEGINSSCSVWLLLLGAVCIFLG